MLVHPDKNMGNEKAAEAFKKLQNAYEVIFIYLLFSLILCHIVMFDSSFIVLIGLAGLFETKSI